MKNLIEIVDNDSFVVDLMYAGTKHNMTGRAIYAEIGLGNHAYVHEDLWEALQKLLPYLKSTNRKLKIYDAWRPVGAHRKLFELIPKDGFFIAEAEKSPHCRATAIDVALIDANGKELVYPTLVDAYNEKYAKEVQSGKLEGFFEYLKQASLDYYAKTMQEEITNREELYQLMLNIGLVPTPRRHEWWHYELPKARTEQYPVIDF